MVGWLKVQGGLHCSCSYFFIHIVLDWFPKYLFIILILWVGLFPTGMVVKNSFVRHRTFAGGDSNVILPFACIISVRNICFLVVEHGLWQVWSLFLPSNMFPIRLQ